MFLIYLHAKYFAIFVLFFITLHVQQKSYLKKEDRKIFSKTYQKPGWNMRKTDNTEVEIKGNTESIVSYSRYTMER